MKIFSVDFRRSVNDQYGALATFGSTGTVVNDEKGLALRCKSLATDYITYGNIAAINSIGTGAFSFVVGANIKGFLNHGSAINVLSGKSNWGSVGFGFYYDNTNLTAYTVSSGVVTPIAKNRNTLFILTRNLNGLCTLYKDGISVGTPVIQTGSVSTAFPMSVGYDGSVVERTPNASIYLSEIYNHCLSQIEIDALVDDFNSRTIVSKSKRGFVFNKPTDLSQLKPSLLAAYNCTPKKTILVDISGNLKNGTLTNCITTKEGMMLMGVNSKAVLGNIGSVRSICFRIKPNSATCKILEKAANSGLIFNNSGTLSAADFPAIYVNGVASSALTLGKWHNVVLTNATGVNFSAATLGLNNTTYGAFEIEDLRFWNKTLTAQEVKDYNNDFVRPVLIEDFSSNAADGQIKTPNQWVKGTAAGKVLELASSVSVALPKARHYFQFTTAGTISIPVSLEAFNAYVEYDYYNGSTWTRRSGLVSAPVAGVAYTASRLTITGANIGDSFANLSIQNGVRV